MHSNATGKTGPGLNDWDEVQRSQHYSYIILSTICVRVTIFRHSLQNAKQQKQEPCQLKSAMDMAMAIAAEPDHS